MMRLFRQWRRGPPLLWWARVPRRFYDWGKAALGRVLSESISSHDKVWASLQDCARIYPISRLFSPVRLRSHDDFSAFHYEYDILDIADVRQRVTPHGDDVGELARFQGANLIFESEQL